MRVVSKYLTMEINIFVLLLLTTQIKILICDPLVLLPDGLIRGNIAYTINNRTYYSFKKIPYAAPPLDNLRFEPPQPPQKWEGILDTTNLNVMCFQTSLTLLLEESEDCLYLNVYTSQLPSLFGNPKLPVMLFIYGGGFTDGTSSYYGPDYFIEQDVILVTINYRVGIFGFISTQDDVIPGNNGLKDQHFAIKWVYNNIKLFGGDPEKITIFGQSAGSASAAYQLLYKKSEGLFRAAILQSGTFLSPWAFQRRARDIAFSTASLLNSTFKTKNDSKELVQFLKSVRARALNTAAHNYGLLESSPKDTEISQGFYWAPVVEVEHSDAFLTRKMYRLLQNGEIVKVPILMGMNSEENLAFNQLSLEVRFNMMLYDINLQWLVPNDMNIPDDDERKNMGSLIRNMYTNGKLLGLNLGAGIRYSSDNSFTRSIIKHAEMYSKFAKTYFYEFSYDGKMGHGNIYYDGAEKVGHGEEIYYIFCIPLACNVNSYPQLDQLVHKRMITIWTNFAKYVNPTPEKSELLQNITWPSLSIENGDFLYVDIGKSLQIKNHPKAETYTQWLELYKSLNYTDFDTY